MAIDMMRTVRSVFALFAFVALGHGAVANATPAIQHWETSNGARVYFVPAAELPMVDVRIVFDGGSARDGQREGIARFTNNLLSEGAGELNADQIAERFESVGAQFGASALRDMAIVTLRSLTEPKLLEPAVDTLALVLRDPTFPENGLERERRRTLIAIKAQQQSPEEIADKAFFKAMYGEHPYAHPPLGTEQSVGAFKRDDVVAFHRDYYVARNAVIAIVGAIGKEQARELAEKLVGQLPAGERAPALPPAPMPSQASTQRIAFPSEQTHLLIGQPAITRDDPDFFPLTVGNHVLGGSGLVSRISEEVREKRGLSYSAYSYFIPMRVAGPFTAGLQTRNDQADDALKVLNDTLEQFLRQGPTAKELTAAKQNITGGFALRLDSNGKIAETVAMIGFYGLPLNYLDTYKARVEAVTTAAVADAFKRRLDPKKMATVIVGGTQTAADE